jgi:hypothetical protein
VPTNLRADVRRKGGIFTDASHGGYGEGIPPNWGQFGEDLSRECEFHLFVTSAFGGRLDPLTTLVEGEH